MGDYQNQSTGGGSGSGTDFSSAVSLDSFASSFFRLHIYVYLVSGQVCVPVWVCAKPNANFFFNFLGRTWPRSLFSGVLLYVLLYIRPRTVLRPESEVRVSPSRPLERPVFSLVVVIKNKEKFCTEQEEKN